jgi:hypothetical protein
VEVEHALDARSDGGAAAGRAVVIPTMTAVDALSGAPEASVAMSGGEAGAALGAEAEARRLAEQQEVDEGKQRYLQKKRRQERCEKTVRWVAAFAVVTCSTAFFTLILAYALCEQFNMAMSCGAELQPGSRLPVLASVVGTISSVFWAIDVCWAGIVRRKLLALADKEANDRKKKQQMYAELGIKEAGDEPEHPSNLASMGARMKAEQEGAAEKSKAPSRQKKNKNRKELSGGASKRQKEEEQERQKKFDVLSKKTGLDTERLERFKSKLSANDLARMRANP